MNRTAIILCGGRGKRLGDNGERVPKTLVRVHGQPILWYIVIRLYMAGFRHFILPLGYKGDLIQGFVDQSLTQLDARIDAIETGEDTPIGRRIDRVRHLIEDEHFLLINGDTLFDFDGGAFLADHVASDLDLTLTACHVVSQFGLLFLDANDRMVDFRRDALVRSFEIVSDHANDAPRRALVNSGITYMRRSVLDTIDIAKTGSFEDEVFADLIRSGRSGYRLINAYWFAIDTAKDLEIANSGQASDPRAEGALLLYQKLIRYTATLIG